MKTQQEIFEILKAQYPDFITTQDTEANELAIEVPALQINSVCQFLASNPDLLFDSLILLSALDDANGKKNSEADGSFEFDGGTLSVIYHLESSKLRHKVVLKVVVPREKPEVESVSSIWQHADWEEREAYDMIGIIFLNHPNLQRILMPYDWDAGFPLRKDYKNPEFYMGIKVP
ncbi:MAG: NADH-quinone oxidoreductase subunit C [Ignavibacteria bacterium]|nr:NADH-quinone oxidoreductase subunit C [Ignavibacteria bacterium]